MVSMTKRRFADITGSAIAPAIIESWRRWLRHCLPSRRWPRLGGRPHGRGPAAGTWRSITLAMQNHATPAAVTARLPRSEIIVHPRCAIMAKIDRLGPFYRERRAVGDRIRSMHASIINALTDGCMQHKD